MAADEERSQQCYDKLFKLHAEAHGVIVEALKLDEQLKKKS